MELKVSDIAMIIGGIIEGNPDVLINKFSKIEESDEGSITFLANPKYEDYIYKTKASTVITHIDFKPKKEIKPTLIKVNDVYGAVSKLLEMFDKKTTEKKGIEQPVIIGNNTTYGENIYIGSFTYIGENVRLGNNVKIYPGCYIGDNCEIDDNTIIYQGAKIYNDCKIGKNCIIHSGVVIGADGFGFTYDNDKYKKIPQTGNVVIEDDVEIGANSCIDRATIGSTIIRKGVKLDNLIMVAHNVEIKENTVIAAQTGISGSTKIGKNCVIGGQVGIAGHLTIADGVKIQAQSGIASSIKEENVAVQGSPAFNIMQFKRAYVLFKKLPELFANISNKKE